MKEAIRRHREARGLTQGQLSSLDNMDRAQISRVLSQLMRQNFVTAAEHSGLYNKRYILTEMGQALVDDFCVNLEKIQAVVSGGISQTDLEIFYRTLQTITRNLEQAVSTYQCDPVEN